MKDEGAFGKFTKRGGKGENSPRLVEKFRKG